MMRRNVWTATIAMSAFLSGTVAWAEDVQVYFDSSSAKLSPKDAAAVKRIAKRAGEGQIKLRGSSDPRGSEELNSKLREERVRSVHDLLVSLGVPDSRIESDAGSGADGPPSSFAKLRNVRISYEPSAAGKVAKTEPAEPSEAKQTAAQKRAEAAEAKKAEAEAKKAEAEQKRAEAAEAKKSAAEAKKAEAEQKRAEAEAKKAEAAEAKKSAAEAKKAEAEQKRAEAEAKKTEAAESKKPVEASATPAKKDLEPIKLIYWKSLNHALWIVAKEKGFFAQEGFDVTLQETDKNARDIQKDVSESGGGKKIIEAGGAQSASILEKKEKKFFAGAVCGFAVHEAMAHKEPVVDIGSMIMLPLTMIVPKTLAKTLQEDLHAFKSLRMAERTYGEGEHDFKYTNVLRTELEKVGLKEKTDYSIKEYGDSNVMLKKLENKELDVAIVLPPDDVDFLRNHKDFVRIPFARFFPYLPCCRQLVTRNQLKNSRDRYVRLLRASIRAHEYIIAHPRESAQIMSTYLKMPADTIRQSIMTSYVQLTPDPNRKGIELYQRTNDKATNTHTNTAEYVDTSLYRDALYGLAKEAEEDPARKGYYETMKSRFRANN